MEFFNNAIEVLQTLVVALGAGLGVWGGVNLLEGYGSDNPGSKSQGMKQLMPRLEEPGHEAAHGRRRCRPHRHHPCAPAERPVWLKIVG